MLEAKSLVLMEREEGILESELGSYEIETGLEFVFKAYVEDEVINLFLTTDRDVDDEEYSELFERYNFDESIGGLTGNEEIDDEYNPVWLYQFDYVEDYGTTAVRLNTLIKNHSQQIKKLYEEIKNNANV
jgi:hypothetical protein